MRRWASFFFYFKTALQKHGFVNGASGLLSAVGTVVTIFGLHLTKGDGALLVASVVLAEFAFLSVQTALVAIGDAGAIGVLKAFDKSVFADKYDILYLTGPVYGSDMFSIGTHVSLVYVSDGVENSIGSGVVVNVQRDGRLHVGIDLFEEFEDVKGKIERDTENIYIIPYREARAIYEK